MTGGLQTDGRLLARPVQAQQHGPIGLQPLRLNDQRDGWVYIPKQYHPDAPAPLVLLLHGAGDNATDGLQLLHPFADRFGTILLAVDSRDRTWDVIANRQYGADIAFIDRALTQTFSRYAVRPDQLVIAGFSDGASYALSVGMTNGDLFTHMLAFSPGFIASTHQTGNPRCYISHGIHDTVLPITRCSRRIVPQLQQAGYDVQYREFEGPHTVPPAIALEAITWLTTH